MAAVAVFIAMYHPAAALHQRSLRPVLEADFASLPDLILQADVVPEYTEEADNEESRPEQLSMF